MESTCARCKAGLPASEMTTLVHRTLDGEVGEDICFGCLRDALVVVLTEYAGPAVMFEPLAGAAYWGLAPEDLAEECWTTRSVDSALALMPAADAGCDRCDASGAYVWVSGSPGEALLPEHTHDLLEDVLTLCPECAACVLHDAVLTREPRIREVAVPRVVGAIWTSTMRPMQ